MELKDSKKAMTDEARAKIFIDEFSKNHPMLDYQRELLMKALVNGCPDYPSYALKMKKLGWLYCRDMTIRLCELFDKTEET